VSLVFVNGRKRSDQQQLVGYSADSSRGAHEPIILSPKGTAEEELIHVEDFLLERRKKNTFGVLARCAAALQYISVD
jgi:hypothetical protein